MRNPMPESGHGVRPRSRTDGRTDGLTDGVVTSCGDIAFRNARERQGLSCQTD